MARLKVLTGEEEGRTLQVPVYPVVLGREQDCDLIVKDLRASRRHACLRLRGSAWEIRDLDTPNGTYLDGRRIEGWAELTPGCTVRLGRTELLFEEDETPDAAQSAPEEPAKPELPGYGELTEVGRGASATVYRALQISLDRWVAVKVLDPVLARKPEFVERFVREAQAAASMSHPHVVPVFDVGQHAGLHYFAMEFMEGGTVEDRLLAAPGSKLAWRDAVRIAGEAAAGISYLHEQGSVHRDVKPANLLLDATGRAKLGDMGTVVREDEATGVRIGTPHYMSPEQATRKPVTRASDVYGLGATLYRMLSGQTPFVGQDPKEIVRRVATQDPPPIETLCPGLPPEVVEVVHEMMSRDPALRPVDAAQVSRRLEEALSDVRTSREDMRRARRRRTALATWIPFVLILGVLGGAAWYFRDRLESMLGEPVLTSRPGDAGGSPGGPAAQPPAPKEPPAPVTAQDLASQTYEAIRARDRAMDPPSPANADAWRAIASDYARLAEVFPLDSPQVLQGHWRAREIREEIMRVTGGDAASAAFAKEWMERQLRDAGIPDAGLGEGSETSGIGGTTTGSGSGTARPAGGNSPLAVERDALLRKAETLIERGHVREAFDQVLTWARDHRVQATADRASSETHETIAEAVHWMRRTAKVVHARLLQQLDRDRFLLRSHVPATAWVGAPGKPDPAPAIARLASLRPLLVTSLGTEHLDARRRHLAAEKSAWEALTAIEAPPAAAPATREARQAAVAALVERTLDRLPPEESAGAIRLFLEAGRADLADQALASRGDLPADERRALHAEIEAHLAWRGLPDDRGARAAWFVEHAATDASFLLAGDHADLHPVFPQDEVDEYLDSWGGVPPGRR